MFDVAKGPTFGRWGNSDRAMGMRGSICSRRHLLRTIREYRAKEITHIRQHCMQKLSSAAITPVNMKGRNVDLVQRSVVYILGSLGRSSGVGFLNGRHLTNPRFNETNGFIFVTKLD